MDLHEIEIHESRVRHSAEKAAYNLPLILNCTVHSYRRAPAYTDTQSRGRPSAHDPRAGLCHTYRVGLPPANVLPVTTTHGTNDKLIDAQRYNAYTVK